MPPYTPKVRELLREMTERGKSHVKSKHVADELDGISNKMAAHALMELESNGEVELWSDNSGGNVWRIEL